MVREIERGERKVYVMAVLAGGSVGDGGIGCSIAGSAMVVMVVVTWQKQWCQLVGEKIDGRRKK